MIDRLLKLTPFRLQLITLAVVRTVVNTFHRMVYPLLPVLARGMGVSLEAFSHALALRALFYGASPLVSWISDRYGRRTGLAAGLGLMTAGLLLVSFRPSFSSFVVALILAGLGKSVMDPAIYAFLVDRVPYHRRGRVVAIVELGWSFSFLIGVPLAGLLAARFGWVAPFPILAGLLLINLILIWRVFPGRQPDKTPVALRMSDLIRPLRYRPVWIALSVGLLASLANEVVNITFGTWLEQSFQLRIAALGAVALVIGTSELLGESLVAGISDRIGSYRSVGIGLILNSVCALLLPVLAYRLEGALIGLFLFYLTFEYLIVCSISILGETLPDSRASLFGWNVTGHAGGKALAALMVPLAFQGGIVGVVVTVVAANTAALFLLNWLKLPR